MIIDENGDSVNAEPIVKEVQRLNMQNEKSSFTNHEPHHDDKLPPPSSKRSELPILEPNK